MTEVDEKPAGWTARGLTSVTLSALAALFAFLFLYEDRGAAAGASGIWAFVTSTLLFHALGGLILGWLLAGAFGRKGAMAWPLAVVAGAVATLLAGALGGALGAILPLMGGTTSIATEMIRIGAAAFVTPLAIAEAPWLALVWLATVLGLHYAVRGLRR
ncbi:MAG: hypothetical protein AAGG09_22875 [Pseudomonadota bacterium]